MDEPDQQGLTQGPVRKIEEHPGSGYRAPAPEPCPTCGAQGVPKLDYTLTMGGQAHLFQICRKCTPEELHVPMQHVYYWVGTKQVAMTTERTLVIPMEWDKWLSEANGAFPVQTQEKREVTFWEKVDGWARKLLPWRTA